MKIDDKEVAPLLLSALRQLGDEYGPMGVALVASALTDPVALISQLSRQHALLLRVTASSTESHLEQMLAWAEGRQSSVNWIGSQVEASIYDAMQVVSHGIAALVLAHTEQQS